MVDPRHAERKGNSGPPAPPAAVPILVWLVVSMVMVVVAWMMLTSVGLTYDQRVLRRGEATIQSCTPNVLSLGTTQMCRATIEWEPKDAWQQGAVILDDGPSYTVESTEALSGTVPVEGHPRRAANERRRETIVPAGQVPSEPNPLWFVVGLGIPVLLSIGLMALVILPWIRRRTAAAASDDPPRT